MTDANGAYSVASIPAGYDYTVTPSLTSKLFNPINRSFTMLNADTTAEFQENLGLIYGVVKDGNMPVVGADVHLVLPYAGPNNQYDGTNHAITNAQGEYFFEATIFEGYTNFSLALNRWQNNDTVY